MTARKTIRTTASLREFRELLASLPEKLTRPDTNVLGQRFIGLFLESLMTHIHRCFMVKTAGGSDEFGYKWKPLAASTIARKTSKMHPPAGHLSKRRESAFFKRFESLEGSLFAGGLSRQQAQRKALRLAWQHETAKGGSVPIGIETGQLERSLRPGTASLGYEPPNEDQIASFRGGVVKVVTLVPHATHFDRVRKITPPVSRMRPWLREAAAKARDGLLASIAGGI